MVKGATTSVSSKRTLLIWGEMVPKNLGKLGKTITYATYPGEQVTINGNDLAFLEWTGLFYMANMK
jgi:hypothetical protein